MTKTKNIKLITNLLFIAGISIKHFGNITIYEKFILIRLRLNINYLPVSISFTIQANNKEHILWSATPFYVNFTNVYHLKRRYNPSNIVHFFTTSIELPPPAVLFHQAITLPLILQCDHTTIVSSLTKISSKVFIILFRSRYVCLAL